MQGCEISRAERLLFSIAVPVKKSPGGNRAGNQPGQQNQPADQKKEQTEARQYPAGSLHSSHGSAV